MRHVRWLLVAMWCLASAARAGPNAGGVLWVHDTGLIHSTDPPGPPVSPAPTDCSGVDNQQALQEIKTVWKVYAAFPAGTSPRLKGVSWGLAIAAVGDGYVAIDPGGCGLPNADGPGTDLAGTRGGWPSTDGGMIEQFFPTGPRTATVVELYYFSGYGYGGLSRTPQSFGTVPHADAANRFFLDDATPHNADPIMGYGSLGFGQAGMTPCPTRDPNAVCCAPAGACIVTTVENCSAPDVWHPEWLTCEANPCPPPTGACCYEGGFCEVTLETRCPEDSGTYRGDLTVCDPNPCRVYGVCCTPTGSCTVTTQEDCAAPSVWNSDELTCATNPCPQPIAGTILAWGDNASGQCNTPAPGIGFTAIAAGSWHSLGLTTDGVVVAWGDNGGGQCNVPAPNTGFRAIAAGGRHSLGLTSAGRIVAWGDNTYGQCDVPAPNTDFAAVAAGDIHSLGLKTDGRIVAWGYNGLGQCNVPAPNTDFVAVAGGLGHSLGLKADGGIVAWGDNASGQCAVPEPNAGFTAIAGGYLHSLGLKADGAIMAWGYNDFGQCNVPSPNAGFTAIAGGTLHSLALKTGGVIVAWGSDDFGQCTPLSPEAAYAAVAAGGYHSAGLLGPPAGACCRPDTTCTLTLQAECETPNYWLGAGLPCIPNLCPITPILLESGAASSLAEGLQIRFEVPIGTTGGLYRAWRDPAAGPHDAAPTPEATLVSPAWINASAEGIIEFLDRGALRGETVRYFLERSANGSRSGFLGPVEARWDPPASVWSVGPTPFRGAVRLTPPGAGPARAEIFDPAGRLVRTLERSSGNAPLEWDGRDSAGRDTPTGIYLVRLASASGDAVKRLVKIQ
jgi:hypothetical protein